MMLGGGVLIVLALTFALGLLVGRQWARPSMSVTAPSVSEAARKGTPAARRSGIAAETMVDRAPEPAEKLTFYQTLTEPLAAPGAPPKPEAKAVAIKAPPAPPAVRATIPEATPATSVSLPPPAAKAPPGSTPPWTIQVAAFKNRRQADDLRQQLASSGLDAYVANIAGPEGQARYRVRVGTFKSRDEAAAAADRLRTQRSLTAFVTLK